MTSPERAAEAQKQAEKKRQRAIEEATRAVEGMARVLNTPVGFRAALRRTRVG